MKTLFTTLAVLLLVGCCGTAGAATINFANIADGTLAPGLSVLRDTTVFNGGEAGAKSFTFTQFGAPSVTASGTLDIFGHNVGRYAYLDSGSAGLGVCSSRLTSSAQCGISSDDNVTQYETLNLVFGDEVRLNDLTLKNGNHGDTFAQGSNFLLSVDGVDKGPVALDDIVTLNLIGTSFAFTNVNPGSGGHLSNDKQFYVNQLTFNEKTVVPVPAAAWLFGSGLIGLVGVARRKAV